jgi:putative hydrolase of the HAD superfamily
MKTAIRTLIFDLDDTLVVEEASAEEAFIEAGEAARERYGLDPSELHRTLRKTCRELWYAFPVHAYCKRVGISSWEGLWAEFTGPGPDLKALREWAPNYRFESWRNSLGRHGIDDRELAALLAEAFPRLRRGKHVVYDDTFRTLEHLFGYYAMGLLTNGAPDLQRTKIEGAGVGRYFDEILISGDIGIGKPDRRIYETLISRLRATAETTLMIGNNPATDVRGAQQAGMRAVWLNRSGDEVDILPDWEISRLDELPQILDSIMG